MSKYTKRTLEYFKDAGMPIKMAECWIPNPGVPGGGFRRDLFGFIDMIALDIPRQKVIAIQSCGQDFAAHHRKIINEPAAALWLEAGQPIELWSWRKIKIGVKVKRYFPRIRIYTGGLSNHTTVTVDKKLSGYWQEYLWDTRLTLYREMKNER